MSWDIQKLADAMKNGAYDDDDVTVASLPSEYDEYGVDNEFDLIEAAYKDWWENSPHLLRASTFRARRIACGLDPRYTDKCLESEAFADVRDEILRRLKR